MVEAIFKPIQHLCLHCEFETCRSHVLGFYWEKQLYSFCSSLEIDSTWLHRVSHPSRSRKPAASAIVFLKGISALKFDPSHVIEVTVVCEVCKINHAVWLVKDSGEVSKIAITNSTIGGQNKSLAHLAARSTPPQLYARQIMSNKVSQTGHVWNAIVVRKSNFAVVFNQQTMEYFLFSYTMFFRF